MNDTPNLYIALYTDQDVTSELAVELRERGYTAQGAYEAGMSRAHDFEHLHYAATRNMTLLTYNIDDFAALHKDYLEQDRNHSGIVVSSRQYRKEQLGELLRLVLQLLDTYDAGQMRNRLVYLQEFK